MSLNANSSTGTKLSTTARKHASEGRQWRRVSSPQLEVGRYTFHRQLPPGRLLTGQNLAGVGMAILHCGVHHSEQTLATCAIDLIVQPGNDLVAIFEPFHFDIGLRGFAHQFDRLVFWSRHIFQLFREIYRKL